MIKQTILKKIMVTMHKNASTKEVFKKVSSELVPRVGVEPTHLSVLDFESSASTNSTTEAW